MSSYDDQVENEKVKEKLQAGLVGVPCPMCFSKNLSHERKVDGYDLEKCEDCSLVFMNPRCTPDQLEDIYSVRDEEALIELYEKIATPDVLAVYERKLDKIEEHMPQRGRILDYACAAGYFFEAAQKRGWDAHGYDIGQWAAKAAEKRGLSNMTVGFEFDDYYPANHFDVVYAAQVFEHLLIPADVLKQLLRVLKPGGLLYIDVPNYNTLPIRLNKDDFMLNEPPQHVNFFTPTTLRKLLADGGLVDIKLHSQGGIKYENLLGRPIKSDIAAAYGLVEDEKKDGAPGIARNKSFKAIAKEIVKDKVVNPLFYNRMKVGVNLVSISRKPASGKPA